MNKKRAHIFTGTVVTVLLLIFAAYSAIPAFASDSGINEQEQVTAEAGQTGDTISHEDGRKDLADREVTIDVKDIKTADREKVIKARNEAALKKTLSD